MSATRTRTRGEARGRAWRPTTGARGRDRGLGAGPLSCAPCTGGTRLDSFCGTFLEALGFLGRLYCLFSSYKAGKALAKGYLRPCYRGSGLIARPKWLVTRPRREMGERAGVVGSVLVVATRSWWGRVRVKKQQGRGNCLGGGLGREEDVSKFASSSSRRRMVLVLRFGAAESRARR